MPPSSTSRRAVLAGAALGSVALLAGCRVRWDDVTPEDEARQAAVRAGVEVLGSLLTQVDALRAQAAAVRNNALAARLAVHHQAQASVLRSWVDAQGGSPAATGTARATASRAASPVGVEQLTMSETDGIDVRGLDRYVRLGTSERLTALGVLTHRVAAATLLARADVSGVQPGLPQDVAADLLSTVRPAQFALLTSSGLTTDTAVQKQLTHASGVLSSWESALTGWAGAKAPSPRLGYDLDPRPRNEATRRTLLARALGSVLADVGTHLGTVTSPAHMLSLVTLGGEVAAAGDPWLPLGPFPGLHR